MSDESFGNFLKRCFHEWSGKQIGRSGHIPSQADFAKWLGVPTTSLSVWMNDVRIPVGENAYLLADKLGDEVYDRLNIPRRMPRDKKLLFLASIWTKLDEQEQDELYRRAKDFTSEDGKEGSGQFA